MIQECRPIELNLNPRWFGAVYRLWAADGTCLYVGQTVSHDPFRRVENHLRKPWGKEVARADYIRIPDNHLVATRTRLDEVEIAQIHELQPRYNRVCCGKQTPRCIPARYDFE